MLVNIKLSGLGIPRSPGQTEWYLMDRQFCHTLFNGRNRFLMVLSEKQGNRKIHEVRFQLLLS